MKYTDTWGGHALRSRGYCTELAQWPVPGMAFQPGSRKG